MNPISNSTARKAPQLPLSPYDNDQNLVEMWVRVDPKRWFAGILGGLTAGAISLVFAMFLASLGGLEVWYPAKLLATAALGPYALAYDSGSSAILTGVLIYEAIMAFWGFVYAHFTGTNRFSALLPMGLAWAAMLWVFNWCLFLQSFKPIFVTHTPYGAAFFVCLVYGLSLTSVGVYDRLLGGSQAAVRH